MVWMTIKNQEVRFTTNSVIRILFDVMKDHIGERKAISKFDLFKKVFGVSPDKIKELEYVTLNTVLTNAMSKCRRETKCFIVRKQRYHVSYYFVAKTLKDADEYKKIADSYISSYKNNIKNAYKSIEEKWYKVQWEL